MKLVPKMAEKLVVKNLVKKYGDFTAVKGISFDVKEGEVVALLGPSGCGKTTTLKCIAGLEEVTDGEIYLDGRLINDLEPWQRNIAMVFQSYALYPNMKAYDIIAFPLRVRGLSENEIKRRVKEVAEMLKIQHVLDHKPGELSGGERQRVALARALIRDADVYLLDEPLTNLDAKLRISMRSELREIIERTKATMIYATPDANEAMVIADRIAVMKDGEIVQIGDGLQLFNEPRNVFVATYTSYPPMNIIENCSIKSFKESIIVENESRSISIKILRKRERIRRLIGRKVIVGFRPQLLKLEKSDKREGSNIGKIILIEESYPEAILHCILHDNKVVTAVMPLSELEFSVGDYVHLEIDEDNLYLFDQASGERIVV